MSAVDLLLLAATLAALAALPSTSAGYVVVTTLDRGRRGGFMAALGIVGATLISVGGVKLAYALLAHRLQSRFGKRSLGRRGQTVAGCLLVGAGSWVIVRP